MGTTVWKTEQGDITFTPDVKPRHEKPKNAVRRYSADFPITESLLATMRGLASGVVGITDVTRSSKKGASFVVIFKQGLRDVAVEQVACDYLNRVRRYINTGSVKTVDQVYREAQWAMAIGPDEPAPIW